MISERGLLYSTILSPDGNVLILRVVLQRSVITYSFCASVYLTPFFSSLNSENLR